MANIANAAAYTHDVHNVVGRAQQRRDNHGANRHISIFSFPVEEQGDYRYRYYYQQSAHYRRAAFMGAFSLQSVVKVAAAGKFEFI